jgi:hypothetical protein
VGEITTGNPEVETDLMSHTPGVPQGNSKGRYESMTGHRGDGRSTAQRSTGVNSGFEEPIDKAMPNLSPA